MTGYTHSRPDALPTQPPQDAPIGNRGWAEHGAIAAFALLCGWLALTFGGYHPRHWALAACVLVVAACAITIYGGLASMSSAAGRAMQAGIILILLTGTSWTWAEYSTHLVWQETGRTILYVTTFMLGTALAGGIRKYLAATRWLAAMIALVGLETIWSLATDTHPLKLFVAGRLDHPLGYSNGSAAFFLVGMWLALGISSAAERQLTRRQHRIALPEWSETGGGGATVESAVIPNMSNRAQILDIATSGIGLGAASALAALAYLGQSRGGILAGIVAMLVSLVIVPNRIAWLCRAGIVGASLLAIHSALNTPYSLLVAARNKLSEKAADADQALSAATGSVAHAGTMILVILVACTILGAGLAFVENRVAIRRNGKQLSENARLTGAIFAALICGLAVAVSTASESSPVHWIGQQYSACARPTVQNTTLGASHFSDVGTNRCDFWKVAWSNFKEHPVVGIGANNFGPSYSLQRNSHESPKQAHSFPLQILGELGILGMILLLVIVRSILIATKRYAGSGRWRDPTVASAIVAIFYWFFHSSIDWLWNLPGITLLIVFLAGGLVMCISPVQRRAWKKAAIPAGLGALIVGLALLIPLSFADGAFRHARDPAVQKKDSQESLDAAHAAGTWDPTWGEPKLFEAQLLIASGNATDGLAAIHDALNREPNMWSIQSGAAYALMDLSRASKRTNDKRKLRNEAKAALAKAFALNPQLRTSQTATELAELAPTSPKKSQK